MSVGLEIVRAHKGAMRYFYSIAEKKTRTVSKKMNKILKNMKQVTV